MVVKANNLQFSFTGHHLQDVTAAGSVLNVCSSAKRLQTNVVVLFQLLGVNGAVLTEALTHKKIIAKGEEVGLDTHSHCSASVR